MMILVNEDFFYLLFVCRFVNVRPILWQKTIGMESMKVLRRRYGGTVLTRTVPPPSPR